MTIKTGSSIILLTVVVVTLIIALNTINLPGNTYLIRAIHNAGHFPFFGVLSLLLFALISLFFGDIIRNRLWLYIMAFIFSSAIGILHEFSQIIGPRDADVWDLGRDISGAASFLGLRMICDRKMRDFLMNRYGFIKPLIVFMVLILILVNIIPIVIWGGAYIYRDRNFPLICGFESVWENKFLNTQSAEIRRSFPPENWDYRGGHQVGKLTFYKAYYPGLEIEEPYPDWTGYDFFTFMVFMETDSAVHLTVRIEDSYHNDEYEDRFNGTFIIEPGLNKISVPLDEIRMAPAARDMDMSKIRSIHLFAFRPSEKFALYFDDFRLEKGSGQ
ncbi:MAG: VanZ family protein [Candidatus Zixiibacteriota bacterium]|nr:MAG: VanZ family protein [candidate division Zixibacteria bacterium]